MLSEEQVGVRAWLGAQLGAVIGAVHQSVGQKMLQTRTALAGVWKRGRSHFHWHKPDALLYFSLETAIIQWLFHSQIFGGDNLPVLLISKLTTSDLPYLHSGQKALSPFHFYTGKNYIGCPPDEIYAFLGEIHWCSVQGPMWPQLWKSLMVRKGDEGWAAEHEWLFFGDLHPTLGHSSKPFLLPSKKWLPKPWWLLLCRVCRLSSCHTSQHCSSVVKGDINWCANPL